MPQQNIVSNSQPDEQAIHPIIVIGSGPAGYAASLYTARAELHPIQFTGIQLGGQASLTHIIDNYPGFPEGVGGSELGELFQKHAERFGAKIIFDQVTEVNLSSKPYLVRTYSEEYHAKSIIICTGADPVHLNVKGEKEFTGRGVSYCATCDGWFFKDKNVVVVGGGDSALEEGLFLTRFASKVTIIHRRDTLRAGIHLQNQARKNSKIHFIWNSIIQEIGGKDGVEHVLLKNLKTNSETRFDTDGVFIFIGHKPNTDLFKGQIDLDEKGYIKSDTTMRTNVPGVFAAGEISDPLYRQVITSAGMGAAAAIQAIRYLESEDA